MSEYSVADVEVPQDLETLLRWAEEELPVAQAPEPAWLAALPETADLLAAGLLEQGEATARGPVLLPLPRTAEEVEDPWRGQWVPVEEAHWAVPRVYPAEVSTPLPDPTVQRLARVLADLRGAPLALDGRGLLADTEQLLEMSRQLRVLVLERLREVQERRLFTSAGFRSARSWLTSVAPDADPADLALAGRLPAMPTVGSALAEGTLSVAAAKKVSGSLARCRPHLDTPDGLVDGLPGDEVVEACIGNVIDLVAQERFGLDLKRSTEDEALLAALEQQCAAIQTGPTSQAQRIEAAWVLLAQHVTGRALRAGLEELEMALVPSWLERREKAGQDKRGFVIRPNDDGTWHVEGTLTLQAGERLVTALAAEARRDPANPDDTRARAEQRERAAREAGEDPAEAEMQRERAAWESRDVLDGPPEQLLPRSRTKRLHDALDRLLGRYLGAGLGGTCSKVPVQVTVTIPEARLVARPGALPAKTTSGRLAARSLLRSWWCDAHVTPLLMGRGWTPLGAAHAARTVTGTELKALHAQFGNRCAGEGCCPGTPDPLIPLVPHHVIRYADAGRTSTDETLLICGTFHDDLHLGKKTLRLRNGQLVNENGYVGNAT